MGQAAIAREGRAVLIQRASAALQAQRWTDAIPDLQLLLAGGATAALHRELARCLRWTGQPTEALQNFSEALRLDPRDVPTWEGLAQLLADAGHFAKAVEALEQALKVDPKSISCRLQLSEVARRMKRHGLATSILEKTLLVDPNSVEVHNNLGACLREQGEIAASLQHYRRAVELAPERPEVWSGYLFTLNCDPDLPPEEVAREHRRFGAGLRPARPCLKVRGNAEVLRIGYLSPDFHNHSVAYFIAPVIAAHDRRRVHVTCYATDSGGDATTERVRASADRWCDVAALDDEQLARQIADDGIHVLIELTGHTALNRLPAMARRLAPVQVTYLGYPNTTGVPAIDLRITDELADPVGPADSWHTERLVRLPGGFLAWDPPIWAHAASVGPVRSGPEISFGCFNNLSKLSERVLDTWARLLARLPEARLVLKSCSLGDERVRRRVHQIWSRHGVDPERIQLLPSVPSPADHLACYAQIDVALDPFPYAGTTTTCEALWMGVPVVTLAGRSHVGRVGCSLLHRVGLDDLVAADEDAYIDTAIRLARDRQRLADLRSTLRSRVQASPLGDPKRLARELEVAYAEAWDKAR
jgi:predicted O-linked N-acetylglucosamine transferase (SPINDLY family)